MTIIDPNFTTQRSKYEWSYLISSTKGKFYRTARRMYDKCDSHGPSTFTAMCTFMFHPHLGPPAVSV